MNKDLSWAQHAGILIAVITVVGVIGMVVVG